MKKLSLIVKFVFMLPWCLQTANKLERYMVIILSVHISGIARSAVSFSDEILNNSESNRMYLSANDSTFVIFALEVGNLFCAKYR